MNDDDRARYFAVQDQITSTVADAEDMHSAFKGVDEAVGEAWIEATRTGLNVEMVHSLIVGHVVALLCRLEAVRPR